MMNVFAVVTAVILAVAAFGAIGRIILGPSILDRVLAADVLLAVVGAGLATDMIVNGHLDYLALLVSISLVGFIGSVTVARFVTDRR
ncbi:putative monovalent cation/H+ antiporter subunit F [Arthrobacter saudimassiliensis]|uniref:Putative monovalent cation/H+ antiporter subunit F n=1 Tax=Arthrobacter saudimassiliensis TaxID=1461584 RepID=A0A078MWG3_9MICC|nr:putative monovalent cation/H+ antiporter subunit F [Arthrobacter saudimassiliensis]